MQVVAVESWLAVFEGGDMGGAGVVRRKYPGHPSVTADTIPDCGRLFPTLLSGSVGQVSFVTTRGS